MKKLLFIAAVALVGMFAACAGSETKATDNDSIAADSIAVVDTVAVDTVAADTL